MRHALRRATQVIAVSHATRQLIEARVPIDASRVSVVHHGVDHERFMPAPAPFDDEPYFLCVGNAKPYKDIPTAMAAFAGCARRNTQLRLVVAGRMAGERTLRDVAERHGVSARVHFRSNVDHQQLLALLHGATALLSPSIVEGFHLPVLEAMAAGCPVIVSDAPALLEAAGGEALHFPVGDAEALAREMQRLLDEPPLASRLRAAGIARARQLSWDRCADETVRVYQRALDQPCGS